MPPKEAMKNTVTWAQNEVNPRRKGECVSRYTSHACATDCIQVPISDTSWPEKNRR